MFEIGKDYRITSLEGGDEISGVWKVVAFDFPLLKLQNPYDKDKVVNTASPNFVSAQLVGK